MTTAAPSTVGEFRVRESVVGWLPLLSAHISLASTQPMITANGKEVGNMVLILTATCLAKMYYYGPWEYQRQLTIHVSPLGVSFRGEELKGVEEGSCALKLQCQDAPTRPS